MQNVLPSKKILVLVVIILFLGGGFLALAEWGSRAQTTQNERLGQSVGKGQVDQTAKQQAAKDSDGDGLKDWEEVLWGTDKNNPDTDGDGTPDGKEVEEERDPTVPGPDDALPEHVINRQYNNSGAQDTIPNTQTNQLSRSVLNQISQIRDTGNVDGETIQQIVDQITSETNRSTSGSRAYQSSDLQTTGDNSKESLRAYLNTLGTIAQNAVGEYSGPDELDVIKTAITTQSPEEFDKLAEATATYRSMEQTLLSVTVPSFVAQHHLSLTNGISTIATALEEIPFFFEDPVRGMRGIQQYQSGATSIQNAILRIKTEITKNGVVVTKGEPGYIFFE